MILLSLLISQVLRAAPVDATAVTEALKRFGLSIHASQCRATAFSEGEGEKLKFAEMAFDCGDTTVQLEASYPVNAAIVSGQVESEMAKIYEIYSASKNPYSGYISQTAQCPQNENLYVHKQSPHSVLIGRLTARGAWGACGKSAEDFWGAMTFVETREALAKIRVAAKKPLARTQFSRDAQRFLQALKVSK